MRDLAVDEDKGQFLAVVRRFPDRVEAIRRLFESEETFQLLCGEYDVCLSALTYWSASNKPEAPDFRAEFASMLIDLEEEILELLAKQVPD